MLEQNKTTFFLVEEDKIGAKYPLSKAFNGNGFQKAYEESAILRFESEEKVKKACSAQNMMNSLFGSDKKVMYVKEDVQRVLYDDAGNELEFESDDKDSQKEDEIL